MSGTLRSKVQALASHAHCILNYIGFESISESNPSLISNWVHWTWVLGPGIS